MPEEHPARRRSSRGGRGRPPGSGIVVAALLDGVALLLWGVTALREENVRPAGRLQRLLLRTDVAVRKDDGAAQ